MTVIDSTVDPILPMFRAVGKIPSGLFILTAGRGPDFSAMLVSFVQQAARDPIMIAAAINRERPMTQAIERSGSFVLSIIGAGDRALLKHYARHALTGSEALAGIRHRRLDDGSVILSDACAWIQCRFRQRVEFGADHDLFLGVVEDGGLNETPHPQPVVHIRHDGSNY
jgi:flavin reductase (DIM6/NTAB) family NADH-FMN oxidoreductase RutF